MVAHSAALSAAKTAGEMADPLAAPKADGKELPRAVPLAVDSVAHWAGSKVVDGNAVAEVEDSGEGNLARQVVPVRYSPLL